MVCSRAIHYPSKRAINALLQTPNIVQTLKHMEEEAAYE